MYSRKTGLVAGAEQWMAGRCFLGEKGSLRGELQWCRPEVARGRSRIWMSSKDKLDMGCGSWGREGDGKREGSLFYPQWCRGSTTPCDAEAIWEGPGFASQGSPVHVRQRASACNPTSLRLGVESRREDPMGDVCLFSFSLSHWREKLLKANKLKQKREKVPRIHLLTEALVCFSITSLLLRFAMGVSPVRGQEVLRSA